MSKLTQAQHGFAHSRDRGHPMVYAIFLPASCLPLMLILFGLIFRGTAHEVLGEKP
jgi:hypothetical protein